MDNTIADFLKLYLDEYSRDSNPYPQSRVGFFAELEIFDGVIDAINKLKETSDVYFLTRPSIMNKHCYTEKAEWIEKYFGLESLNNLILCCDKSMIKANPCDILIDDSDRDGQLEFGGMYVKYTDQDWNFIEDWLPSTEIPKKGKWLTNNPKTIH